MRNAPRTTRIDCLAKRSTLASRGTIPAAMMTSLAGEKALKFSDKGQLVQRALIEVQVCRPAKQNGEAFPFLFIVAAEESEVVALRKLVDELIRFRAQRAREDEAAAVLPVDGNVNLTPVAADVRRLTSRITPGNQSLLASAATGHSTRLQP